MSSRYGHLKPVGKLKMQLNDYVLPLFYLKVMAHVRNFSVGELERAHIDCFPEVGILDFKQVMVFPKFLSSILL